MRLEKNRESAPGKHGGWKAGVYFFYFNEDGYVSRVTYSTSNYSNEQQHFGCVGVGALGCDREK